jgi:hypothetical protein
VMGTSCLDVRSNYPNLPSGSYSINPGAGAVQVWCDMSTDSGGYTYYACSGCTSALRTTDANGCTAKGLQMVIPRTRNHWLSMFEYVTRSTATGGLGSTRENWFRSVPGISKATSGRTDCSLGMGYMTSDSCAASGWRAADGGRWWLRASTHSEPNGDYTGNVFLGLGAWNNIDTTANAFNFNDVYAGYAMTNYLCSTNDHMSGFARPPSPPRLPVRLPRARAPFCQCA